MPAIRTNARTFGHIVAAVEDANAARLIARARAANRIAKMSSGRSRKSAYAVKARALAGLAERFPERVCIALDYEAPGYVLIHFGGGLAGLHAPAPLFDPPTAVARVA